MAAWAGRAAQGLFDFRELLLQIFVDDPLWFVRGTAATRRRLVVVLLLFWQVFGIPFSWAKGSVGPEVVWIGASLIVENSGPFGRGIRVEVPPERLDYLREDAEQFLKANVIGRKKLRSFAGGASFVAGLIPLLRPFLSGLWAALKDGGTASSPAAPAEPPIPAAAPGVDPPGAVEPGLVEGLLLRHSRGPAGARDPAPGPGLRLAVHGGGGRLSVGHRGPPDGGGQGHRLLCGPRAGG